MLKKQKRIEKNVNNNSKAKAVARYEKKYLISVPEYRVLSSILKNTLSRDPHSDQYGNYIVRSLYFDSIDDRDLYEKKDGIYNRQKVRLRIYDTNSDLVKLENKCKHGKYIKKYTRLISKQDALKLIDSDYKCLLTYNDEILDSIYAECMLSRRTPKAIVEYQREAYIYPINNIRINFDKHLKASNKSSLFDESTFLFPIQDDHFYVLEVKYSDQLPFHFQSMLSSFNLTETSYSKYEHSRTQIF